MNEAIINNIRW